MKSAYDPAAQSEHAAAPDTEYFPASQGTHFDIPVLAAYVPAAQSCGHASQNQKDPRRNLSRSNGNMRRNRPLAQSQNTPCIGRLLWSPHHGCTSQQDTLRKRLQTWTQCWCCTCLLDTPCTQQLTLTQSDRCTCLWGIASTSRWMWRRCWRCTCLRDTSCTRRGKWTPCWCCRCLAGKECRHLSRRLQMSPQRN